MSDVELIKEILCQVLGATRTIAKRFAPIVSADDFVGSEAGLEKLDAICMQLIAIGESIKHLDKVTGSTLLPRYPQVEWKRVMGMRDVLTHHYFDLDAEIVYSVCTHHIGVLDQTVEVMLADLTRR
jgi:uncharacterized protein with HEPN domain